MNQRLNHRPRSLLLATGSLVALLAATPGCKLIDQRTFAGNGVTPAQAQLGNGGYAAAALPPLPLLIVRFDRLDSDWEPTLLDTVHGVLEHRPNARIDLVTPIPTSASLDLQDLAIRSGAQDAQEVAGVLLADGIPGDQIHLASRGDPGQPVREVRLYIN